LPVRRSPYRAAVSNPRAGFPKGPLRGGLSSYFALKLTHNWWLWGIDIQFDAYVDEPQLRYFDRAAGQLQGGERVLLVTGKPSWTNATPNSPSYENLRYLEERIIET
jgi:hypothetical protein